MKQNIPKSITPLPPLFAALVQAGFPSPADDYIEKGIDLNEELIRTPAATFFVRVTGDSMKDAHIHKGDVLVVDRSLEAKNGKIVVALVDGEFTVKRLRIEKKALFLDPENSKYPSIEISPGQDFSVWGVVTYIIHTAV